MPCPERALVLVATDKDVSCGPSASPLFLHFPVRSIFCSSLQPGRSAGMILVASRHWRWLHVTLLTMRSPVYFLLLIIYSFSVLVSRLESWSSCSPLVPLSSCTACHYRMRLDILDFCCTLPQPCSARSGHVFLAMVRISLETCPFHSFLLCEEPGTRRPDLATKVRETI